MKHISKADIERMSEDQLRTYAKQHKVENYDVLDADSLEKALIATVEGHAKPADPKPDGDSEKDRKRVWFKLLADQRATGDAPVFASYNGNAIMVHRNKWVPLPIEYLPCFTDAVEKQVTIQKDGSSKESDVPRYNFQYQPLTDINTPPDGGEPAHGF